MNALEVTLQFRGGTADQHAIDLYDISQALIGFERSLALTTHLILNDEIITHAPALKGAQILARPANAGSWELTAAIIIAAAGAFYKLGTAPKDTPIGHLIRSAYDYVVSQSLGIHVDYEKTLGQQFKDARAENKEIKILSPSRFDSLIEKCEAAVKEMHRPIVKSETANEGRLISKLGSKPRALGPELTLETYEYVAFTTTSPTPVQLTGRVSSYNSNTFKGRINKSTSSASPDTSSKPSLNLKLIALPIEIFNSTPRGMPHSKLAPAPRISTVGLENIGVQRIQPVRRWSFW